MTGLRRYAVPVPVPVPRSAVPASPPAERCEMCGVALDDRHGHVVALDDRALRCVCRACRLLFTASAAGGGRIRAVPERYLSDPAYPFTDADWRLLQIPVTPAFLFLNSDLGRVVACYPSPAGTTESLPDLDGWNRVREAYPLLRMPAADVEAVYVTRAGAGLEAYLVPIDACFSLAGAVRQRWRGVDGGAAVRQAVTAFADDLRARSRPRRADAV